VAFTRVVYAEDGSDAGVFCVKAPNLRMLTETHSAGQIVPELAPRPGELMVFSVRLSTEEARLLWKREHDSGGWAVNGELTQQHWDAQLRLFQKLNPALRAVSREAGAFDPGPTA
jgi:hypothetical protein